MSSANPGNLPVWTPAPARAVSPKANEVHVRFARIDELPTPNADELRPDEWDRANRLRIEKPRLAFMKCRAWVRRILSECLIVAPLDVEFAHHAHGKPFVVGSELRFNLSHSGDGALLAVSLRRELGVDLESVEYKRDWAGLARRYFSALEVAEFDALDPVDRILGFYNGWARKEAFIKALGDGLHFPLESFAVRLAPGADAELLWVKDDQDAVSRWKLYALDVGAEWSSGLVVEGPFPVEISFFL